MSIARLLANWQEDASIYENIQEWRTLPARDAITRPLPPELHPAIRQGLRNLGIEALYLHQSQAWESVFFGCRILPCTGTASGKTYCYSLPVLQKLLQVPTARALYFSQPKR